MNRKTKRWIRLATLATIVSTGIQFEGCFTASVGYVANLNPCGTILNCDPAQYSFATSGYDGPGADPEVDPWCTYPPYCSSTVDPQLGTP